MLDTETIATVARHAATHDAALCVCPCLDALLRVAKALDGETSLRARLAKVSPEALAALALHPAGDAEARVDG